MKGIIPLQLGYNWAVGDANTYAAQVPTVNAWDITTNPLKFTVNVPHGERWLMFCAGSSYVQGPNIPTYQTAVGTVLTGATQFRPPVTNGPTPWSYWLGIAAQNDAAWGSWGGPLWFNPGATVVNFGYARDAGAITIARRLLSAAPMFAMRI